MPLTYEDLNNLRQHCFHNYGQELQSEVTRDLTVQDWDDRFRTLGNPERDFFISFHPEDIIQVSYQDDIVPSQEVFPPRVRGCYHYS